ncbi:MAG: M48 family metallopeptidase [Candidatus Omnitrophica bacterium]|nr:M48 family metallopeptidase [Candidatus Omnitrophota bacterium]
MNIYLVIVLVFVIGEYVLNAVVDILNVRHLSFILPQEFEGYFDTEKYRKAQKYLKENTWLDLTKDTFFTVITVIFILAGGFDAVDQLTRSFHYGPILSGLIFAGILTLVFQAFSIPFSLYRTFVVEEKYGFNRTTLRTFVLDIIKSWLLGAIIKGGVFSAIIWFFNTVGKFAWFYSWIALVLFRLSLAFVAPVLILPLFNKFIPLENSELKEAIQQYAISQNFKMKNIFKMDASRRTIRSNASFIGFGRYRRIILFDNLIQKHTNDELVSILAHEIGHCKKKHFIKSLLFSIITAGLMFFILSFFINNKGLFSAFKMKETSVYASLFFFRFLYSPLNLFFNILRNTVSKKYEYEADAFVVSTYRRPEAFVTALKKLSCNNLSNLTPHPLKVLFDYTHPPVLKRVQAISSLVMKS